jgi:hypothetical protein
MDSKELTAIRDFINYIELFGDISGKEMNSIKAAYLDFRSERPRVVESE